VASTNASAYTLKVDNVSVGYKPTPQGAVVEEWKSYTPSTLSGFGTPTSVNAKYRRVGSVLEIRATWVNGSVNASYALISLPSGLTLDSSILGSNAWNEVGTWSRFNSSANAPKQGKVTCNFSASGSALGLASGDYPEAQNPLSLRDGNTIAANGDVMSLRAFVPIAEWVGSGTVNLAQNDVEYASNYSVTNSDDTNSFAYGPAGSLFPAIATSAKGKQVRFQSPIQPTDKINIELWNGVSNAWVPIETATTVTESWKNQAAVTYGMGFQPNAVNTDLTVYFGTYRTVSTSASYGAAGVDYTAISNNASFKWRVRKTSAGAAVSFGTVSSTRLGLKQYVHGTTYNGGNAPTVTLTGGGGTLTTLIRGVFVPYQLQDGSWRLKFSFRAIVSSATRTDATFTVNGVISKNVANWYQTFFGTTESTTIVLTSYTTPNAATFGIFHSSATTSLYNCCGDIELESKPTWAY
jgi:hypothetical protein